VVGFRPEAAFAASRLSSCKRTFNPAWIWLPGNLHQSITFDST